MAEEASVRTCYVICPIGEKDSEIRRRSNQVMKHLIKPALAGFGYDVRRSDSDADPGEIPAQIIQQMASAELVVADLSDANPNVFYELAIRHVAAKPLVQIITAGQTIPFDVSHMRTVHFNLHDPDDLEEARNELTRHVEALQGVEEVDTPVKASLRLKEALESSDPATADNAAILAELQAVRADVERLRAAGEGGFTTHRFRPSEKTWLRTPPGNVVASDSPMKTFYYNFPESQEDPAAGMRGGSAGVAESDLDPGVSGDLDKS